MQQYERDLWQGKPELIPFVFNWYNLVFVAMGLLFMILSLTVLVPTTISKNYAIEFVLFTAVFLLIGLAFTFGMTYYSIRKCRKTEYLVTDQRIIIKPGVLGNDFRVINFYEAGGGVRVTKGFSGTGSIFVENPRPVVVGYIRGVGGTREIIGPDIRAIKKPYIVARTIQDAIQDYKLESQRKSRYFR